MTQDPGKTVSIADVAKLANVSISTVSRVVNQRSVVNAKTRDRVESAIDELGYQPNPFARGLMLRRSEIVGLVLPDLHGEFYSEIIRGADSQARALGYHLLVSSARDGDDGHSLLASIRQRGLLDGLAVMVSELTDRVVDMLGTFRRPLVVLDDGIPGAPHDSVLIDQRHGAITMMHHLTDTCGFRRIIFLGGLRTNLDTIARYGVYREVLDERGLSYSDDDIYFLNYEYDTAYKLALSRLQDWVGENNAVFAANDEMAAGVVAAAAASGVSIPRDLAVVGFDDTRIARMTRPALSTVHVSMAQMGATAIELLCKRISDPDRAPTHTSLRPELVLRDSCGYQARRARH